MSESISILDDPNPDPAEEIDTTEDFISLYLDYTSKTECPRLFHRWTAITALSAYMGRRVFFNHGHFTIYPNLYTMLIGSPGTKKSSGIKIGSKLLKAAGYFTFSAKKTRQEKFLLDLAEQSEKLAGMNSFDSMGSDILDENLGWGSGIDDVASYIDKPPAEVYIDADEFNNFIGTGNLDFISILGELWDFEGVYDYKLKNSKSVFIPNPTVTILGGNTPTGFAQAFPAEAIGQGFFSRLLLIYGEPSGVKYTFPPPPDLDKQKQLIAHLHRIKEEVVGEIVMSEDSKELLDKIYHGWKPLDDPRFEHYANRRLTHLIKICLVVAGSRLSTTIETRDVIYANTLLTFTEQLMPKALGEFGKAKNSAVTHLIMTAVDKTLEIGEGISVQQLWKITHNDLNDRNELVSIISNLVVAEKIQNVDGKYLPVRRVIDEGIEGAVDWGLLTDLERKVI